MITFKYLHIEISRQRGFTLLIAVIFMGVVLAIGTALGSLGYKQALLASSALESQYAFYAADAGLECALRADEQENSFSPSLYYNASTPNSNSVGCGGTAYTLTSLCYNNLKYGTFSDNCANEWVTQWQIPLAYANPANQTRNTDTRCAVVTIYKPIGSGTTYLFSQGYDVACRNISSATVRFASRGLSASYQN